VGLVEGQGFMCCQFDLLVEVLALPLPRLMQSWSKVVKVGKSDPLTLQQEADSVNQWSIANNMKLNVKKTKEFIVFFLTN
jgi:hypothetical protein